MGGCGTWREGLHGEGVLTPCMSERGRELFTHCGLEREMWQWTAATLITAAVGTVFDIVEFYFQKKTKENDHMIQVLRGYRHALFFPNKGYRKFYLRELNVKYFSFKSRAVPLHQTIYLPVPSFLRGT